VKKFWNDVQALVGKGLVNRGHSAHLVLSIRDVAAFKKWLLDDLNSDRRRFALTPDVQVIVDPATDPSSELLGVFSVRGRVAL